MGVNTIDLGVPQSHSLRHRTSRWVVKVLRAHKRGAISSIQAAIFLGGRSFWQRTPNTLVWYFGGPKQRVSGKPWLLQKTCCSWRFGQSRTQGSMAFGHGNSGWVQHFLARCTQSTRGLGRGHYNFIPLISFKPVILTINTGGMKHQ